MENNNQVYSFSARKDKDKFEVDYLKAKCSKEGLNFSQLLIKLIRNYNANEQGRA